MSGLPGGGQTKKQKNKVHLLPKKRPSPNPQLIEQDIKDYHWAMFKHNAIFETTHNPKKTTFGTLFY
jgi:hypothetical protein